MFSLKQKCISCNINAFVYLYRFVSVFEIIVYLERLLCTTSSMPKKFASENSKAVAAKDRKNEKAALEKSAKQKKAEDEYWADDDKSLGKYVITTLLPEALTAYPPLKSFGLRN